MLAAMQFKIFFVSFLQT